MDSKSCATTTSPTQDFHSSSFVMFFWFSTCRSSLRCVNHRTVPERKVVYLEWGVWSTRRFSFGTLSRCWNNGNMDVDCAWKVSGRGTDTFHILLSSFSDSKVEWMSTATFLCIGMFYAVIERKKETFWCAHNTLNKCIFDCDFWFTPWVVSDSTSVFCSAAS